MAKILVIDDSASTLELVGDILTSAGHQVTTANSGKRGRAILTQEPLDLVITDVYMPDVDGLEVLRDVRRIRPGMRVIAMSSMAGKLDMLVVAKALGAVLTLRKPFCTSDLLDAVDACLQPSTAPGAGVPGA